MYWKTPLITKVLISFFLFLYNLNFFFITLRYFLKSSVIEFLTLIIINKLVSNSSYSSDISAADVFSNLDMKRLSIEEGQIILSIFLDTISFTQLTQMIRLSLLNTRI